MGIPNMCTPTPLKLVQSEQLDARKTKFNAFVAAFHVLPPDGVTIEIEYLEGMKYQGVRFTPGDHVKLCSGGGIVAAKRSYVLRLKWRKDQEWQCGLACKQLIKTNLRDVPTSLKEVHGNFAWYVSDHNKYAASTELSSLQHVDVKLCKLVNTAQQGSKFNVLMEH